MSEEVKKELSETNVVKKECDLLLKPTGPIPAGYSYGSYPKCDGEKGEWYWYDPAVA